MTNEHKDALTSLCKIEIKRWKGASESNPNMRYMVELMEIALTALTAHPVAWIVEFQEPITDDYCRSVKSVELEKPAGHYLECATPLIRAAGYEVIE